MASQAATLVGNGVPNEFRGRAYAVFPNACYLRDEDGNQLVLLDDSMPPAPHGISVPLQQADFRRIIARDARVNLESGVLTVVGAMATREAYTLSDVPLYDGHLEGGLAEDRTQVHTALDSVASVLAEALHDLEPKRSVQAARRRVSSTMDRMAEAIAEHDEERLRRAVGSLLGFGPDLIPCGDSALVGFLAACAACDVDYGIAKMIGDDTGHTSEMSWGFLSAAADKTFTCPLHDLAGYVRDGCAEKAGAAAGDYLESAPDISPDVIAGMLIGFSVALATLDRP